MTTTATIKTEGGRPHINQLLDWQPSASLASMATVSAEVHRRGMRNLAAAVNIISCVQGQTRAGLTATAVCSVTADPPRLVVFANKNVYATPLVLDSGSLCVNVLAGDQEEVARAFAGMLDGVQGAARFNYGQWDDLVSGTPALIDALVNFDCRVVKVFDESTHYAFLCEVLATRERASGDALVYMGGRFCRVGGQEVT